MEQGMTRRKVIGTGALWAGCICGCRTGGEPVVPRSSCCYTPDIEPESVTYGRGGLTIDLRQAPSLWEVGNAAYVVNPARSLELIVIHAETHRYCALSRICTHGEQAVSYNRDRGLLQCNSFNHSLFTLDGRVWKGPATGPLKAYAVVFVEDALVISI